MSRDQRAETYRNVDLGHAFVNGAPDHRPAVRLRAELARDRQAGYSFASVFDDEVDFICSAMRDRTERAQWRAAFNWARAAWQSAYELTEPASAVLNADMLAA